MLLRCLAVLALAATGCTLDYDALITGAGGGDGTTSSGDATSTSGGSTSTTTTSSSTATTAGSTSSGDGGQGGAGGSGGAGGTGGAGGAGGELPFAEPCGGLAITWTDDLETSLGETWEESDGNDVTPTTDPVGGLTFTFDAEPESPDDAQIQTVSDEALFECSVTVALAAVAPDGPLPEGGRVEAALAAGGHGIEVRLTPGDGAPRCVVAVGALGTDDEVEVECASGAPEHLLRIRHTGTELCYDIGPLGGPLAPVGACTPVDGARRVFVGAVAEAIARVNVTKIF